MKQVEKLNNEQQQEFPKLTYNFVKYDNIPDQENDTAIGN